MNTPGSRSSYLPTRRDIVFTALGAAIATPLALNWSEKKHADPTDKHLTDDVKEAFFNQYSDEYDMLVKLGQGQRAIDKKRYDPKLVEAATKKRLLMLLCSDERNDPARAREVPIKHDTRAEQLLHSEGANGIFLAGTGVLLNDKELKDVTMTVEKYMAEIAAVFNLKRDETIRVARHDECGACAKKAAEMADGTKGERLSWDIAERVSRNLHLPDKPLSIGYDDDAEIKMKGSKHGHFVLGAVVSDGPHFRGQEMHLPPMFGINGDFGPKNTQEELKILHGIASDPHHGLGEDWMRKHPFIVALQGNSRDAIAKLHAMVSPTVKEMDGLAKIVHLNTSTAA